MPDESQLLITGTESRNVIINAVSLSEVASGDGNLRTTSKITKLTVQVGWGRDHSAGWEGGNCRPTPVASEGKHQPRAARWAEPEAGPNLARHLQVLVVKVVTWFWP